MLASSSNQISSFPFMSRSTSIEKSIQIHDEIHENPISRSEQTHPPSLQFIDCYNYNYNFNPFVDDQEFILGHILYSQKHQLLGPEIGLESANNANDGTTTTQKASSQDEVKTDHTSTEKPISRRRTSGTDRHSKICTSKGPRDRRMRLSLEIARRFFDLQDMLGFDKASKTVEWLFTKSRSAIKELKEKYLAEANCNNGTKSSCDSTLVRKFSVYHDQEEPREKKRRKLRIIDKESRYKARARARERTRAKSFRCSLEKSKRNLEGNPVGVCKMGDVIEESSTKSKIVAYQQITNVPLTEDEKNLRSKGKSSASLISNRCEDKVVSKESCSDEIHLPGSSMDMGALSLDTMKASPAGLKLLELDEIDGVLIFYGE